MPYFAIGLLASGRDLLCTLKDDGVGPDQIDLKVTGLVHAARGATGDGDVGEAPDEFDYAPTGAIIVKINLDREMYLSKNDYGEYFMTLRSLQSIDPALKSGALTAFKITVHKGHQLLKLPPISGREVFCSFATGGACDSWGRSPDID